MYRSAPQIGVVSHVYGFALGLAALGLLMPIQACGASADVSGEDERVENLYAFAKLYGYVRYFHPSDAAAATDWERFAVHGARVVGSAEPGQLADTLRELFAPIAPTVQIYRLGEAPPPPDVLTPANAAELGMELVAWQHVGVGLGNQGPYRSARLNRRHEVQRPSGFGTVVQMVDAAPYRGLEVRLEVAARADVTDGGQAQPWLRVDRPNRQVGFFDNLRDRPLTTDTWQQAEIVGPVADDAVRIAVGGLLAGAGTAYFDDFRLSVRSPGEIGWSPVELTNSGFETEQPDDAARPAGWGGGGEGYEIRTSDATAAEGEHSVRIAWAEVVEETSGALFEARPEPGEFVEKKLGAGLAARVPLALYSRAGASDASGVSEPATLRPDGAPDPRALRETLASIDLDSLTAADQALRVADVVMAWNIFQHFYPYFDAVGPDDVDVDVDWHAVLGESLRRALADTQDEVGPEEFAATLRWMMSQLHDGHGFVRWDDAPAEAKLPIRLGEVEGRVAVLAIDRATGAPGSDCFRRGDVVISIDGRPAEAVVQDWKDRSSGTEQWKTARSVRRADLGAPGSLARLELDRNGERVVCEAERTVEGGVAEERPEPLEVLDGGIFYVDLSRAAMDEISPRLEEIAEAPGVVFDLRGYPQGNHAVLQHLTDEPLRSAHWQVPQQIYPDQERRVGFDTSGRWLMEPAEPRIRGEVAFLTDGRAISYAESVMGIVEHYRLGEIVGSTTAGTNGNVNPFVLPGGFRVTWTGMRVLKNDGSQHHLVGIRPTVPAERTLAGLRAGRDEVLERAVARIQDRLDER